MIIFTSVLFLKEDQKKVKRYNSTIKLIKNYIQLNYLEDSKNDTNISISLSNIKLELGGVDNKHLYVYSNLHPDITIIIDDGSLFLKKLNEFTNNTSLLEKRDLLIKKNVVKKIYRYSFRSIIVASTIGIITLLSGIGITSITHFIPSSVDEKIGEISLQPSIKQIAPLGKIIKNKYSKQLIDRIQELFLLNNKSNFLYDFYIIASPVENAFALPGGKIVIFTGLIQNAAIPEEVFGVIAHEIAHVEKRHGLQRVLKQLGIFFFLQLLLQDWNELSRVVVQNMIVLNELSFSREMETEADLFAIYLMNKANISPKYLSSFFKKILKEEEALKTKTTKNTNFEWLSTHPLTSKRIKFIEEQIKEKKNHHQKFIRIKDWNWNTFKRHLK